MPKEIFQPVTEVNFLNSIRKNDLPAFSLLYDRYSKLLFAVIYDITGNSELSEDILQKAFCVIWKGIKMHDTSKQRLLTWMICIARNLANEAIPVKDLRIR